MTGDALVKYLVQDNGMYPLVASLPAYWLPSAVVSVGLNSAETTIQRFWRKYKGGVAVSRGRYEQAPVPAEFRPHNHFKSLRTLLPGNPLQGEADDGHNLHYKGPIQLTLERNR